jgi:hypothetical protein
MGHAENAETFPCHGHSLSRRSRAVGAEADGLLDPMAAPFPRVETRRRVRGFVLGLLADLPRTPAVRLVRDSEIPKLRAGRSPALTFRWRRV